MSDKHTPGPWEVFHDDDEIKVIQSGSIEHGRGWRSYAPICEEVSGEANARLLASAPELLEALKTITRMYVYELDREGYPEDCAAEAAYELISRIEGP